MFSTAIETSTKLVQPFGRTLYRIYDISICHHFLRVPFWLPISKLRFHFFTNFCIVKSNSWHSTSLFIGFPDEKPARNKREHPTHPTRLFNHSKVCRDQRQHDQKRQGLMGVFFLGPVRKHQPNCFFKVTLNSCPKQVIWTYLGRPQTNKSLHFSFRPKWLHLEVCVSARYRITGAGGSTASRGETRCGTLAIEGWRKPLGPLLSFIYWDGGKSMFLLFIFVCQFHWVQMLTSMILTVSLPWVFSSSCKESNEFRRVWGVFGNNLAGDLVFLTTERPRRVFL